MEIIFDDKKSVSFVGLVKADSLLRYCVESVCVLFSCKRRWRTGYEIEIPCNRFFQWTNEKL